MNFTGLAEKYGIIQNENDRFRGDRFAILYDPGDFPAILLDDGKYFLRNGGVPQEGNLSTHLHVFREIVDALLPSGDFAGVAVIDFESWRPIYRQNFGSLEPYKDLSLEIEKQRHPFWSKNLLEKEALKRFESSGRTFVEETIKTAKEMRPNATWGYYAYPYCFNMAPKNMRKRCPPEVMKENDRLMWLFESSDNLHPSFYLSENRLTAAEKIQMIEGRIEEAQRIQQQTPNKPQILPYFWFKYQDTKNFVSKRDLFNSLLAMKGNKVDGFVLWGSSNDVNTKTKCYDLFEYIDGTLGPILLNT